VGNNYTGKKRIHVKFSMHFRKALQQLV